MTTSDQAIRQHHASVRKAVIAIALVFVSIASNSTPLLAANHVPIINQPLVPDAAPPGGGAFTLTVNGTGFVSGSAIEWNGSPRTTTFVSGSQLSAAINAADIALAGTASVTVVNPPPGGGRSNPLFFSVTTNTPTLSLAGTDYLNGSRSQAVATADLNGDGKLDLAVGNLDSATVSIFVGNGDGTFKQRVDFATGLFPNAVAVGDFNGDGKPDLALANGSGTVSVLLGNGDGTFQTHVDYPAGPASFSLAVGDFNGDGKLDLVVVNNNSNQSGTISILLGNGDGTFQPHVDYPVGIGPYSVAVGDFNRDGKLDLVVANYPSVFTVSVLLGNGDGTFQSQVTYPVGRQPISVAVADLNGDGKLDLAVADFTDGFVSVLLGNGDGTFQPSVEYPTGRVPSTIIIGDFNGDGKLDVATSNFAPGGYTVPPGYINILFGNGDGTFQAPVAFVAGPNPDTVVAADLNNDGALDFITGSGSVPGAATFSVLLQVPRVSLSSNFLTFPSQWVTTTSVGQNLTLTNTGSAPLRFSSIGVNGDFVQTNACGTSVAAGANCTLSVAFTPAGAGARSAVLTITDNATDSPHTVALSGTGTDFSATTAQGSQTTATVVAGQTATYNLVFSGTSGFTGNVALTCTGAPSFSTCTISPASLSLNGTNTANTTVSVSTTARAMTGLRPPPIVPLTLPLWWLALAALLASATFALFRFLRVVEHVRLGWGAALLFVAILVTGALSSCGGGGGTPPPPSGTPAGTYNLTVTSTVASGSATLTHNTNLTLTVN
jgi:FG-GAP-like repeat/Protein of unknown function (DUF1573)/FG-GAP repeat